MFKIFGFTFGRVASPPEAPGKFKGFFVKRDQIPPPDTKLQPPSSFKEKILRFLGITSKKTVPVEVELKESPVTPLERFKKGERGKELFDAIFRLMGTDPINELNKWSSEERLALIGELLEQAKNSSVGQPETFLRGNTFLTRLIVHEFNKDFDGIKIPVDKVPTDATYEELKAFLPSWVDAICKAMTKVEFSEETKKLSRLLDDGFREVGIGSGGAARVIFLRVLIPEAHMQLPPGNRYLTQTLMQIINGNISAKNPQFAPFSLEEGQKLVSMLQNQLFQSIGSMDS